MFSFLLKERQKKKSIKEVNKVTRDAFRATIVGHHPSTLNTLEVEGRRKERGGGISADN